MKRKINIRKIITVWLIIYFTVTFISQKFTIYRINEQIRIQRIGLDIAKKQNIKLMEQVNLLRSDPDGYTEKRARDMQYVREGETLVVEGKKSKLNSK